MSICWWKLRLVLRRIESGDVRGYLGNEYEVVLTVDEWTDSPLIEVRDATSGEVVKLVEIAIMCWPRREHDRGEPFRR